MNRISPTVKQLLIINVIFYFGSSFSLNTEFIYSLFSLHFPENPEFKFWQLLTHMFMHGGILHLAFNMFALWMFGSAIESIFGSRRFLFFYLTCGLGAAIAQISFLYYSFYSNLDLLLNSGYEQQTVLNLLMEGKYNTSWVNILGQEGLMSFNTSFLSTMVGASGAIMGVLVAFGMFFPESKLMLIFFPVPVKAKYFIPGIILLDLFSAITGQAIFSPSNTAFIAHLGGAFTGFLIMYYWKKNQFNRNRWF
ncbi:MAG: rhomboid family intramembrane serine protease [Flavobacteriales bacterium]|nr:rhomboid family intramembrane serine protease [Flavobacteriales bacterium]|tara:strand:+ start:2498 stop:3250 length:753 start_codon:yes stop_codon:yes gene_type:complete